MLIANVAFSRSDDAGTVAGLTLYPPHAFDVLAQAREDW